MKACVVFLLDAFVHVGGKVTGEVWGDAGGWWRKMHNIYEALSG